MLITLVFVCRYTSGTNQQPDGSHMEDCTSLELSSIRPSGSWHDVPCAFDEIAHYFCKRPLDTTGN